MIQYLKQAINLHFMQSKSFLYDLIYNTNFNQTLEFMKIIISDYNTIYIDLYKAIRV